MATPTTTHYDDGESESDREIHDSDVQSLAFSLVICTLFLAYAYQAFPVMHKLEKWFPHASANMFFGLVLGLILSSARFSEKVFTFDSEFFFIYLLPPIIFNAGYTVPKDFFFHNFGSIMLFAFVGTALSSFAIGGLVYAAYKSEMDFTHCMMLGSLISAVDPVAVIVTLKVLSVDEQLKVILFGESVLNDAAAVVINRVFVSIEEDDLSTKQALGPAIPQMIGVAVSSMLIGTMFSLTTAFLLKNTRIHKYPEIEFGVFWVAALVPYTIADALALSGITAILFAGIMADYYSSHHLSRSGKFAIKNATASVSLMTESFVFIYLGMSFFLAPGSSSTSSKHHHRFGGFYKFDPGLAFYVLALCFFGRALSVFPLGYLLNMQRKHLIPFKHQLVLWYSGLRGPVAYALAVSTPKEKNDKDSIDMRDLIISTTLFVVAVTNFIVGGLTYPFLKLVKPTLMTSTVKTQTESYDISNHWFSQLDRRFLSPYFGPDHPRKFTGFVPDDEDAFDDFGDSDEFDDERGAGGSEYPEDGGHRTKKQRTAKGSDPTDLTQRSFAVMIQSASRPELGGVKTDDDSKRESRSETPIGSGKAHSPRMDTARSTYKSKAVIKDDDTGYDVIQPPMDSVTNLDIGNHTDEGTPVPGGASADDSMLSATPYETVDMPITVPIVLSSEVSITAPATEVTPPPPDKSSQI